MIIRYGRRRSHGDPVNGEPGPPVEAERFIEVPGLALAVLAALTVLVMALLTYCSTRPDPMWSALSHTKPASVPAQPALAVAKALPAVLPPVASPTTPAAAPTTPAPRANFAPPSPVPDAVDPDIGFTTAQCLWWKQWDKTEFSTRVSHVYGDTWFDDQPDMNYKGVPTAVIPCLNHVTQAGPPMDVAGAKSRDAMEPAPKSGFQTILDALIEPFKWLLKILRGSA